MTNRFGTVCDDRFDVLEARVVCGQLGFSSGVFSNGQNLVSFVFVHADTSVLPVRRSPRFYGAALTNTPIVLRNLRCSGNEDSLLNCPSLGFTLCQDSENAGVRCGGVFVCEH